MSNEVDPCGINYVPPRKKFFVKGVAIDKTYKAAVEYRKPEVTEGFIYPMPEIKEKKVEQIVLKSTPSPIKPGKKYANPQERRKAKRDRQKQRRMIREEVDKMLKERQEKFESDIARVFEDEEQPEESIEEYKRLKSIKPNFRIDSALRELTLNPRDNRPKLNLGLTPHSALGQPDAHISFAGSYFSTDNTHSKIVDDSKDSSDDSELDEKNHLPVIVEAKNTDETGKYECTQCRHLASLCENLLTGTKGLDTNICEKCNEPHLCCLPDEKINTQSGIVGSGNHYTSCPLPQTDSVRFICTQCE
jgi:hypothetical protein